MRWNTHTHRGDGNPYCIVKCDSFIYMHWACCRSSAHTHTLSSTARISLLFQVTEWIRCYEMMSFLTGELIFNTPRVLTARTCILSKKKKKKGAQMPRLNCDNPTLSWSEKPLVLFDKPASPRHLIVSEFISSESIINQPERVSRTGAFLLTSRTATHALRAISGLMISAFDRRALHKGFIN